MNFGNIGFFEFIPMLLIVGFFGLIPLILPIWLLIVIHRMSRQIDMLSSRVEGLIELAANPRHAGADRALTDIRG